MEIKSSMGLFFTDDLDFAQYSNYFAIHGISPWAHAGTEGIALITVDFTRVRRRRQHPPAPERNDFCV